MEGSENDGYPFCHHPFIDGIFHEINHPAMGVPQKYSGNTHAI